jgi:RNA recognition motif-containing protein
MSYSVTEDSLKDFFMENKVRAIKVMIMRNEKGQSKGSALIEFSSSQDADFVVQNLYGSEIEGRQVSFDYQKPAGGGYKGGSKY